MKSVRSSDGERALAVFIDFENLGLGFQNRRDRFDIHKVLERLVEKGKIVAKKAYADWSRFSSYTTALHEAAIELVEIPRRGVSGKNSADIRLVVDAIDLAYSKDHIDTFVIVSGDSDFSPLVSKLKELGKHVIGMGLADATSDLLRDNCDEFIYYEDLDRAPTIPVSMNENIPERKRKAFALLLESLLALRRENKEIIYSSMIKETMKRKKPSFNEEYYGYRTFSEFLEDAQRLGLLELDKHKPSGTYIVTRFGLEMAKQSSLTEEIPGRSAPAPASSSRSTAMGDVVSSPTTRAADVRDRAEERSRILSRKSSSGEDIERIMPAFHNTPSHSPAPKHAEFDEPLSPINRPLGRALVEEAEWEDDELGQVPSYGTLPPPAAAFRSRSSPKGKAASPSSVSPASTDQAEVSSKKGNVSLPSAPRSARSAMSSQSPRSNPVLPTASSRKATPREEKRGSGGSLSSDRSGGIRNGGSTTSVARRSCHSSDSDTTQASPLKPVESSPAPTASSPPGGTNAPFGQCDPPIATPDSGIDEEAEFRAGLED